MKANELRIGNYIQCNYDNRVVEGLKEDLVYMHGAPFDLKMFKPIPLTNEWLVKFGFRKSDIQRRYFLPIPYLKIEIHSMKFRGSWIIELHSAGMPIVTEVLQVHQLQNLYFALTNEELTIS